MKRFLILSLLLLWPSLLWANLTMTAGTAIDLSSAGAGTDVTITFDFTEVTGGTTWDDGGEASVIWTWNLVAGDPSITFGNALVSLNTAFTSGGTITSSGTFDVTGATGLTLGSADVTGFTVTTDGTGNAEFTLPADVIGDDDLDFGSGAGQIDLADIPGGVAGASAFDFGGATSVEVPNTAGNVTVDAAGEIALDSTNKQLAVYDGIEKAIPLVHSMQLHLDLATAWDIDHEWQLVDMDRGAGVFPNGIVITSWYVDCSVADPTTELNANLYYCDALANGAFPGANPVLIDVVDTTTGNSSCTDMSTSDLGSGTIPTAKILYLLIDADPTDATTVWSVIVNYYIPES